MSRRDANPPSDVAKTSETNPAQTTRQPEASHDNDRAAPSLAGMAWRTFKRINQLLFGIAALYLLLILLGLIPVNNDFRSADADGVEIFVISNAIHADLIVPLREGDFDWKEKFPADLFAGDTKRATHAAIGWGDRAFFVDTPTWREFRASTAANALFLPSTTCMHVSMTRAEWHADAHPVRISTEQYQQLVAYIDASFQKTGDGEYAAIPGARYGQNDAFFEARGVYHCCNTCNCWVGRGLRKAGVRTGWFTPLPKTVFLYLPAS